jgi:hypothetical protein
MQGALSDVDRVKLIKLLGMFGSAFDGERANAASLADKLVRANGITWDRLIVSVGSGQRQPQRTWRDVIGECLEVPALLSAWELDFLVSISAWRGRLTPKQQAKLVSLATRLGVELAA